MDRTSLSLLRPRAVLVGLALLVVGAAGCTRAGIGTAHRHPSPKVSASGTSTSRPPGGTSTTETSEPSTSLTSSTPSSTTSTTRVAAPGLVVGRVTVVGDSVTIDAAPALKALIRGCSVDAQVGEQWETGLSVLEGLRASGQLGSVVVVALGTNGPVSVAEFQQMMGALRGVSRVVVVTDHAPDYWEETNNTMFEREVRHYPEARIANWDALAKAHPQWLYSDGTHMPIGGVGAYAWARLVKRAIVGAPQLR